ARGESRSGEGAFELGGAQTGEELFNDRALLGALEVLRDARSPAQESDGEFTRDRCLHESTERIALVELGADEPGGAEVTILMNKSLSVVASKPGGQQEENVNRAAGEVRHVGECAHGRIRRRADARGVHQDQIRRIARENCAEFVGSLWSEYGDIHELGVPLPLVERPDPEVIEADHSY